MAQTSVEPAAPPANPDPAARTRSILDRVFAARQPRDFAVRLWTGEAIPPDRGIEPRFTIVINREGALRRMFWPPDDLAVGEAFIDGEFDIEGDIIAAIGLGDVLLQPERRLTDWLSLARDVLALPSQPPAAIPGRQRARMRGRLHSRERDRAAIQYHYDVGNDFYSLWLDSRLVYSCAYFRTGGESIDEAQEAKLDIICRKLRLRPGERLLDIGCGWGGLVTYAAEKYGVQALGITLSQRQYELANERIRAAGLEDRARVELEDYRDVAEGPFDKIVSVGMFEHVGRARLPQYFENAYRLLKPQGLFLNHGIAAQGRPGKAPWPSRLLGRRSFSERYIFPDGELVRINEALGLAEAAGFEVRDVESWREHYALTLRHWLSRLEARAEEACRIAGERTYRTWRLFLAGSAHGFDRATTNVYQSLLVRPAADGASAMPWTREAWYR